MSAHREWSDLSAEARSAKVDAVAKRMVDVADDAEFAARIAAALPARRPRFSWLVPQLTAAAAIALAAVVWFKRDAAAPPESTIVLVPLRPAIDPVEPYRPDVSAEASAKAEAASGREGGPVERLDHERALPAVEAPAAIVLSDVAPDVLPAFEALTLKPLEIGELGLTTELYSSREFR